MQGPAYDPREPRLLSKKEIATIRCGLDTPGTIYVHESLVKSLPPRIKEVVQVCMTQTPGANIVGIHKSGKQLSFLTYPDFATNPHPAPARETIMNLDRGTRTSLEYSRICNLPVLARKEKLVAKEHPQFEEFKKLTQEEESAHLLPERGELLELKWQNILEQAGARIEDHTLHFDSGPE